MIKLIREHLSTKIFIITVCLLITVGGAIYGMVALGMSRSYFLELDRSLSNKMLIVLEKFLDWKSIGAFTSMQIYAQNKDICYLILSGTIILLLSISISLFPILCTKPKKILAEMEG